MFKKFKERHQFNIDTAETKYDDVVKPIKIRISFKRLYDELYNYLKNNEYENIFTYKKFNELFGTKGEFELTFSIIEKELEGICVLNISLYDEFKKGAAYKAIKPIIQDIKNLYTPFIVE